MEPILSILIPSLHTRLSYLFDLLKSLEKQILMTGGYGKQVELLVYLDGGNASIGAKRNNLLSRATGKYSVFIDDDDMVSDNYIQLILDATQSNPDVIPIHGYMTTNGGNKEVWRMGLGFPYSSIKEEGRTVYLRYPNHLAPIKSEISKQFSFENISFGEDYNWATEINNSGLLKTEKVITDHIYHYKYIPHK